MEMIASMITLLRTNVIKAFGTRSYLDLGVWARPSADYHYYDCGVEIRKRSIRFRLVLETKTVWELWGASHSEILCRTVSTIERIEGGYDPDDTYQEMVATGVNAAEAHMCINLAEEWLSRKIPGFSWRGFTIADSE